MRKRTLTSTVKAHITPSRMRDVRQWAQEEKISVSAFFRRIIAEHLIAKGWKPSPEEHRVIFGTRRLRSVSPGGVYLIKCGDVYKIGRSRNLASRLAQMSLPHKPRIVYWRWYNDPCVVELSLHAMFPSKRLNGEWFSLDERDVLMVKQFMGQD